MPTFERLPGSTDFTSGAHWRNIADDTTGTAPSTGDSWIMNGIADAITVNVGSAATWANVWILNHTGQLGASGSPLTSGTMTGKVYVDSPSSSGLFLGFVVPILIVLNGSPGKTGCVILGTVTALYGYRAQQLRIGAAATVTTAHIRGTTANDVLNVHVEAGAAIATWNQTRGNTTYMSDLTSGTLNLAGGSFRNEGSGSGGNLDTINQWGGKLLLEADKATYATLTMHGGECIANKGKTATVTNSSVFTGARLIADSRVTFTNNTDVAGGVADTHGGKNIIEAPI